MQIGFNLPVSGPMAAPATMAGIAQLGESLGFDYLTLTDHLVLPEASVAGYPYSESGEFYSPDPGHRHEQLTTAAYIAAKTERIRLVLAVRWCRTGRRCWRPRCWRPSTCSPAGG